MISKIEALKEMVPSMGMNPEQILTKEALIRHETAYLGPEALQDRQSEVLTSTLRELILATASGSNQLRGG